MMLHDDDEVFRVGGGEWIGVVLRFDWWAPVFLDWTGGAWVWTLDFFFRKFDLAARYGIDELRY